MGFSRTVIVSLLSVLVSLELVSSATYTDLRGETLSGHIPIRIPGRGTPEQPQSEDIEANRQSNQDHTVPAEGPNIHRLPSLAQFDSPKQEETKMTNAARSHHSPYSISLRSMSSSALASPASPSSSSLVSLSSPSSLPQREFSRRVPSARSRVNQIAQLVESRRRAARARQSELRAQSLSRTILNGLNVEPASAISIDSETRSALLNWLLQQHQTGDFRLAQRARVQRNCYLGQCSVPRGVNATLWQDLTSQALRLNFQLPRLNSRGGNLEEVEQAELNLFVKPREGCPCVDENGDQIPGYIVSVHQFTRRLVMRKRRVVHRTTLLESVRIPFGGNAWLRLNVTQAAQMWMARPRRNLGLEIQVKHSNGTLVDARSVIGYPDCTTTVIERSCVYGSSPGIQLLPWPQTWRDRNLQLVRGRPYLDLRVVDGSQTTLDASAVYSSTPRRLGTLNDFLASRRQGH